jgi:hypothetical protein
MRVRRLASASSFASYESENPAKTGLPLQKPSEAMSIAARKASEVASSARSKSPSRRISVASARADV